jgi:hypothetical protein
VVWREREREREKSGKKGCDETIDRKEERVGVFVSPLDFSRSSNKKTEKGDAKKALSVCVCVLCCSL